MVTGSKKLLGLLLCVWFEIREKINTPTLSSGIHYIIFLVFKLINDYEFCYLLAELFIGITKGQTCTKEVCLDTNLEKRQLRIV